MLLPLVAMSTQLINEALAMFLIACAMILGPIHIHFDLHTSAATKLE